MIHDMRLSGGLRIGIFLFLSCFAAHVSAEETLDYSKGFEKFFSYGLTDVKDAEFFEVNDYRGSENAWLLEKKKDGTHVFLVSGTKRLEIQKNDEVEETPEGGAPASPPEEEWEGFTSYRGYQRGSWKPVDLKEYIQTTMKIFENPPASEQGEEAGSAHLHRMMDQDSFQWGPLFLQACHIYRKGHPKEASLMAGAMFKKAGNPRIVIENALEHLANSQYREACEQFQKSGDWKGFDAALETLTQRYSSAWKKLPIIQILARNVKLRAALSSPPPLNDPSLSKEDLSLAMELATDRPPPVGTFDMNSFWLFKKKTTSAKGKKPHALSKIMDRGLASIPLLIAMAEDDTLTHHLLNNSPNDDDSYHYYSNTDSPSEKEIAEQYNRLLRPATRGDIALKLLEQIMPGQREYDSSEKTAKKKLGKIRAWYKTVAGKSEVALIQGYLDTPESSATQDVINHCSASEDPQLHTLLEKHFLDADKLQANHRHVTGYVHRRGKKARAFVESYVRLVRKNPNKLLHERMDPENKSAQEWLKNMLKELDTLEQLASGKSLNEMIAELHSHDGKWNHRMWREKHALLNQAISQENPEEALTTLLNASLNSTSSFLKVQLLEIIPYLPMMTSKNEASDVAVEMIEDGSPLPQARFNSKNNQETWRKLLQNTQMSELSDPQRPRLTIGEIAAGAHTSLFEGRARSGKTSERSLFYEYATIRAFEIQRQQRLAIVDGKNESDIPPWPQESLVKPERKNQIINEILGAPESAIHGIIKGLNDSERLALIISSTTSTNLNLKLVSTANTITRVSVEINDPSFQKKAESWKGKVMDRKLADEWVQAGLDQLKKGISVDFLIQRWSGLDGVTLHVYDSSQDEPDNPSSPLTQAPLMIGIIQSYSTKKPIRSSAKWELPPSDTPKKEAVPPQNDGDDTLQQDGDWHSRHHYTNYGKPEDFMTSWDVLCGKDFPTFQQFLILLKTQPAGKKP